MPLGIQRLGNIQKLQEVISWWTSRAKCIKPNTIFIWIQCYMIVWFRYSRQGKATAVIHSFILQPEESNEVLLLGQKSNQYNHKYYSIQPASQLFLHKWTLTLYILSHKMLNWRLWSSVLTRVVGCTCIQQGLKRLHHDAHVGSKVSFILHTQCSNSCKLFEQQREQEKCDK